MRSLLFFTSVAGLLFVAAIGCNQNQVATDDTAGTDEVTQVSFANTKCPIMGGKPTEELVAQYEGQTIGFCCEGCPEKWAALSAEEQAEKFAAVRLVATDSHSHGDHDHGDHGDHDHGDHDHGDHDHGDHDHGDHDHGDHDHGDHDHGDGSAEHDHGEADHGDESHGDSDEADSHGDTESP